MVNTFLPYDDFEKIAKVLDNKRLGKQRVEGMQILNILLNIDPTRQGWKNHPVVVQWRGHTEALKDYVNIMIREWIRRGFRNSMILYDTGKYEMPWFVKCKAVNLSHQASLLRKNKEHYEPYFADVPAEYMLYSYIWAGGLTEEQKNNLINGDLDISKYAKTLEELL
jgi:hypothetical protein